VSSELVKKHDGSIRVRSQLGKGTVFAIWLPTERRQRQRIRGPDSKDPGQDRNPQ
jgi:signal transduction histidine kinase